MADRTKNKTLTIAKKIRTLRENKNITQRELADKLNKSESAVRMWELGKSEPDIDTIKKLAEFFQISSDELIGNSIKYDNALSFEMPIYRVLKKIPILGSIRAGMPMYSEENFIGEIEIPEEWTICGQQYFALKVKGDSMAPRYLENDIVILKQSPTCNNGQVCAVLINGDEATLKKVIFLPDKSIMLQPINPNYKPLIFTLKEQSSVPVVIQGVAVRIIRDEEQ